MTSTEDFFEQKVNIFIEDIKLVEENLRRMIYDKDWDQAENLFKNTFGNDKFIKNHKDVLAESMQKLMIYTMNHLLSASEDFAPFFISIFQYSRKLFSTEDLLKIINNYSSGYRELPQKTLNIIYSSLIEEYELSTVELLKSAINIGIKSLATKIIEERGYIFDESNKDEYFSILKLAVKKRNEEFIEIFYNLYKEQFFNQPTPEILEIIKLDSNYIKLYTAHKDYLSGNNLAEIIAHCFKGYFFRIEEQNLFEDAYDLGYRKDIFSNSDIKLILEAFKFLTMGKEGFIKKVYADYDEKLDSNTLKDFISMFISDKYNQENIKFGTEILQEKISILLEDDAITLLAELFLVKKGSYGISADNFSIVMSIYNSREFGKEFLQKIVPLFYKESSDEINSASFLNSLNDLPMFKEAAFLESLLKEEAIYNFLLEIANKKYIPLDQKYLSQNFIKIINTAKIPQLVWNGEVEVLDKIDKIINNDLISVNNKTLFFQKTKDSCFGNKGDLNLIDVENLLYPLEIVQNSCDTKIRLKDNKILVAHGHQATTVFNYIMQKTQGDNYNNSLKFFNVFVNAGHGFFGISNMQNETGYAIGFYPTDTKISFDYTSSSIVWGSSFEASLLVTTIATGSLYLMANNFITAAVAIPVAAGVLYQAKEYIKLDGYEQIFYSTTSKVLSAYNEANNIFGPAVATTSILLSSFALELGTLQFLFGKKVVALNFAAHAATVTYNILPKVFNKEFENAKTTFDEIAKNTGIFTSLLNYDLNKFIPDIAKKIFDITILPFKIYSYLETITDRFAILKGIVRNDNDAFKHSKENFYPKLSFIINKEQEDKVKLFIKSVTDNCVDENSDLDLCLYQALSKNCYQFVQNVKNSLGLSNSSYYEYLSLEQKEALWINNVPMLENSWKSHGEEVVLGYVKEDS